MDYSRIDVLDQGGGPNQGVIWQGGSIDTAIDAPPFVGPLLVVVMDKGESNDQFIDHATVEAVLAVWIDDSPDACLKDSVLMSLAGTIGYWLNSGGNAFLHCAAGVSRASYIDIAVHCIELRISANKALALIKAQRPVANPNPGFLAQLQRLWPDPVVPQT